MVISYNFWLTLVIVFATVSASPPSVAERPLGQFGVWEAFAEKVGGNQLCYMATEAIKTQGNYKKRGRTYVMVTHGPTQNSNSVVSVEAGYSYKEDSEVEITIGKQTFKLFTSVSTAFAYDTKTDHALVNAMVKGAKMTVKGFSSRGTQTTDTYSLKGFSASYNSINEVCKV